MFTGYGLPLGNAAGMFLRAIPVPLLGRKKHGMCWMGNQTMSARVDTVTG
ncbi:hypothetical protein Cocul_01686 [Corynebacterium oculi]|uniref:Uncharacterized protein n=1 Tax=Corynebacterium oculi TaxID=1544416 RepID=A0A0Q0Z2Y3_9CORY|nr:hypothetical protein Cocul_01686 [Corynebacterium oculi]